MSDKEKFVQLFKEIDWPLEIGLLEDTDLLFRDKTQDNLICIAFDHDGKFISFYTL